MNKMECPYLHENVQGTSDDAEDVAEMI